MEIQKIGIIYSTKVIKLFSGPGGKGFAQVMFFNTKEAVDWVEQQQVCLYNELVVYYVS